MRVRIAILDCFEHILGKTIELNTNTGLERLTALIKHLVTPSVLKIEMLLMPSIVEEE